MMRNVLDICIFEPTESASLPSHKEGSNHTLLVLVILQFFWGPIKSSCLVCFKFSKVHRRSLNLYRCLIMVPKFAIRPLRSSNLFIWVISALKLVQLYHFGPQKNHPFRSSNLSIYVISIPKLSFKSRSK